MSERYLSYIAEYHVLICLSCRHCISKTGLRLHFQRRHRDLPLRVRRELEDHVENLDVWRKTEVSHPSQTIPAIEGLKVQEGFICSYDERCNHLTSTDRSMMEHCRSVHSWIVSKGRGRLFISHAQVFVGKNNQSKHSFPRQTGIIFL